MCVFVYVCVVFGLWVKEVKRVYGMRDNAGSYLCHRNWAIEVHCGCIWIKMAEWVVSFVLLPPYEFEHFNFLTK